MGWLFAKDKIEVREDGYVSIELDYYPSDWWNSFVTKLLCRNLVGGSGGQSYRLIKHDYLDVKKVSFKSNNIAVHGTDNDKENIESKENIKENITILDEEGAEEEEEDYEKKTSEYKRISFLEGNGGTTKELLFTEKAIEKFQGTIINDNNELNQWDGAFYVSDVWRLSEGKRGFLIDYTDEKNKKFVLKAKKETDNEELQAWPKDTEKSKPGKLLGFFIGEKEGKNDDADWRSSFLILTEEEIKKVNLALSWFLKEINGKGTVKESYEEYKKSNSCCCFFKNCCCFNLKDETKNTLESANNP